MWGFRALGFLGLGFRAFGVGVPGAALGDTIVIPTIETLYTLL